VQTPKKIRERLSLCGQSNRHGQSRIHLPKSLRDCLESTGNTGLI